MTLQRIVSSLILAAILAGCAINPADVKPSDPIGVGASMKRCVDTSPDQPKLSSWFAMFGPGLACR